MSCAVDSDSKGRIGDRAKDVSGDRRGSESRHQLGELMFEVPLSGRGEPEASFDFGCDLLCIRLQHRLRDIAEPSVGTERAGCCGR